MCYYYCCQALIGRSQGLWMSWLPLTSCANATNTDSRVRLESLPFFSWPSPADEPASEPTNPPANQSPSAQLFFLLQAYKPKEPTSQSVDQSEPLPHSLIACSLVSRPDASGPLIPHERKSRLSARMPYIDCTAYCIPS